MDMDLVDNPPRKKPFERSILDNFTKLTNPQERIRIKSGVNLLKHLVVTNDDKNIDDNHELKYTMSRLIRGLGSTKLAARTGFFTTSVALFSCHADDLTIGDVMECVGKELHKGSSNSKGENADIALGQILVAGAVLRSLLFNKSPTIERQKILEMLLSAGKDRTYLNLATYTILIDSLHKLDDKNEIATIIQSELISKQLSEYDLDRLYLLFEMQRFKPHLINGKFLRNHFGTNAIISANNFTKLAAILMCIPRALALNHPIYEIFPKLLINNTKLAVDFIHILDTTQLIKSNRNKLLATVILLTKLYENLVQDFELIPDFLTKNFLQHLLNYFRSTRKDLEFQQIIYKLFDTIYNLLKLNDNDTIQAQTRIKLLKKLLFAPGTFIFEKTTRSKLIQNITGTLNCDGVKKLSLVYKNVMTKASDDKENDDDDDDKDDGGNNEEKLFNLDRIYASHLFVKLINHVAMREENDWKINQLTFLMRIGLLTNADDECVASVGHELTDNFKKTFYSSLDLKLSKLHDLRTILSKLVHNFDALINSTNYETVLRNKITLNDYELWQKTITIINRIEKIERKKRSNNNNKPDNDDSSNLNSVFHTLFLQMALQLFNDTKLATDSLNELISCYERLKKPSSSNDDDPLWIEVVVELFLYLLSQNSHLLRNVINCVFPHLCPYLNMSALHQILSVLDPKSDSNPLSNRNESSDDDDDDQEDEESSSNDDDDDKSESESSDDDDDNVSDLKVNDKLRMALQNALLKNDNMLMNGDNDDDDDDSESIDLDEMDEEQGEKLNAVLQEAFKQYRPTTISSGRKKSKQDRNDEQLTHFRVRVLDLIEIYLNSNPSMILCLNILLPLLQTLEFSIRNPHQKPLQDRVRSCLKKLTGLKKFRDCDDVDETILCELIESLLEKGTKNCLIVQEMSEKLAETAIFIVKCSQKIDLNNNNNIAVIIRKNLDIYFNKRDCLTPYVLFRNALQLNWNGILILIPSLYDFVFDETLRPFRRNQAIELLKLFYCNQRFFASHPEWYCDNKQGIIVAKKETKFVQEIFNVLSDNAKINNNNGDKFINNLFNLMNCIKSATTKRKLKADFEWDKLNGLRLNRKRQRKSNNNTAVSELMNGNNDDADEQNDNKNMKKIKKKKFKRNDDVASI